MFLANFMCFLIVIVWLLRIFGIMGALVRSVQYVFTRGDHLNVRPEPFASLRVWIPHKATALSRSIPL